MRQYDMGHSQEERTRSECGSGVRQRSGAVFFTEWMDVACIAVTVNTTSEVKQFTRVLRRHA